MKDEITPKFYITSCNVETRDIEIDRREDLELKQETLEVTLRFSGSAETTKISNKELLDFITKKLKVIP